MSSMQQLVAALQGTAQLVHQRMPTQLGGKNTKPSAWVGVGVAAAGAIWLISKAGGSANGNPTMINLIGTKEKPGVLNILNRGAVKGSNETDETKQWFEKFYSGGVYDDLDDQHKAETPSMVGKFYNMVTDFYEYGWGQSFHFAARRKGQSFQDSIREHENLLADAIDLKPGMRCIDLGCGVGGPMRQIARYSGAHITGVTINEYQVKRAKMHNTNQGLDHLTKVVQGNYLALPFADQSFDAAYGCEATCHSPTLEEVYAEAFRVLKPGSLFCVYEWLTARDYDPNNKRHRELINNICHDNGLPDMRSPEQAENAGRKVGFELISSRDLALTTEVPWTQRMNGKGKLQAWVTHTMIKTLETIRIAPKGTADIHWMLMNTAWDLCESEEKCVFTPMHKIVFRKPLAAGPGRVVNGRSANASTSA